MIAFSVPGRGEFHIANIVLDYNGTIAADGLILEEIKPLLSALREEANLFVITADTYGTAARECSALGLEVKTFPRADIASCKRQLIEELGPETTAAFGNGCNDVLMFQAAALSVAVLEEEGMYAPLLCHADILVRSMKEGLNLLLHTSRIAADLRT